MKIDVKVSHPVLLLYLLLFAALLFGGYKYNEKHKFSITEDNVAGVRIGNTTLAEATILFPDLVKIDSMYVSNCNVQFAGCYFSKIALYFKESNLNNIVLSGLTNKDINEAYMAIGDYCAKKYGFFATKVGKGGIEIDDYFEDSRTRFRYVKTSGPEDIHLIYSLIH